MKPVHIIDLFCGAGGTSTGALSALSDMGRTGILTAINHWDVAIATHSLNHPSENHLCQSIDTINPRDLYSRGKVDILLASPECMSHSRARGGTPINDQSRATAWCVTRWAEALQPSIIIVENVEEFRDWGPIGTNGRPLKTGKGKTFQAWLETLRSLGYKVDHRILCAADYGDPTIRRRLFVQAVRGRREIKWPEPTHAEHGANLFAGHKWRAAREIINFSHPSRSIYGRKKPLASNTMRRVMSGIKKFGIKPFIIPQQSRNETWDIDRPLPTITGAGAEQLCEPFLIRIAHSGRADQIKSLNEPITTITTKQEHALIQPFLIHMRGTADRHLRNGAISLDSPLPTITANGGHFGLCEPFLIKYYGTGAPASLDQPIDTITTKDRFGLVQPIVSHEGEDYLLDIHLRMLQPDELAAGQGFPRTYQFTGNKTKVTKQIGNAVPPGLAYALVKATMSQ